MLMKFKEGDRVHVTRLDGLKTNFYATLENYDNEFRFLLTNCSDNSFESFKAHKSNTEEYGLNAYDYYVLATDEEDTETPVIQHINDIYNEGRSYINEVQKYNQDDPVNHPDHYNYGEIEIIDFIEQVTQHYNSDVAYHIGNAIKYLARSPHKNGKEDIEKARWYIERAYQKWSD